MASIFSVSSLNTKHKNKLFDIDNGHGVCFVSFNSLKIWKMIFVDVDGACGLRKSVFPFDLPFARPCARPSVLSFVRSFVRPPVLPSVRLSVLHSERSSIGSSVLPSFRPPVGTGWNVMEWVGMDRLDGLGLDRMGCDGRGWDETLDEMGRVGIA